MKIKSSFRDYYDCMQKYGQDSDMLYVREEKKIVEKTWSGHPYLLIGFAGQLHLGYILQHDSLFPKFVIGWNTKDIDNYVLENYDKRDIEFYFNPHLPWRSNARLTQKKINDAFSSFQTTEKWANTKKHLVKHFDVAPIFAEYYTHNEKITIFNARLNRFNFARVKDCHTAYQDLSMYLGNQARPEKPIPKIDDKTMAEIKGFNKFSFRKEKSKK